jgi:hypothetical protein
MNTKRLVITILICTALFSCKNGPHPQIPCGACPALLLAPFIDIKIVDKVTGADLLLSPTSPYKFSDLKVTSSVNGTNVNIAVDTSQTNNRFIKILSSQTQVFTLKLASLPADSINVVVAQDSPKCCPQLSIKQVTLDNNLVCSPCSVNQPVTIKK